MNLVEDLILPDLYRQGSTTHIKSCEGHQAILPYLCKVTRGPPHLHELLNMQGLSHPPLGTHLHSSCHQQFPSLFPDHK